MAFTGNEGAPIDDQVAGGWTRRYRKTYPNATQAHFFGRTILEQMLAETNSRGLRFYYGIDDAGRPQLLAVAADAEQNDLLGTNCIVADESSCGPPWSSCSNPLNT